MRIKQLGESIPSMMAVLAQQHVTPKNARVRKGISHVKAGEVEETRNLMHCYFAHRCNA